MKKTFFLLPIIFLITLSTVLAVSMDREVPTSVQPGTSFQIKYVVSDVTGKWGISIEDSVSGGCLFPSGESSYKSVMLSSDGSTKPVTVTAPSNVGSCSFSGDYKYSDEPVVSLESDSVSVEGAVCIAVWQCGSWGECVDGVQERTCVDNAGCSDDKIESQTCTVSGICNTDLECPTDLGYECLNNVCVSTIEDKCVYTINDFCVETWHLIAGGILLLFLFAMMNRR